jgi:NAD(P)-dependent dehydrogenase (short-subunit alcohol dehydrogenase family)
VLGPVLLAQAALPHLAASKGAIVNVSSTFGARPAPGISQYGASKAALDQLTRSWALELAGRGIRVNAVSPGPTETEALHQSGRSPEQIKEIKARELQRIPLGRRGDPEDVAYWVVALADPTANWTTGQVIGIDGGYQLA